jgi:hypothetical protein
LRHSCCKAGWANLREQPVVADRFSIAIRFFLLAFMYSGAALTASRARKLLYSPVL